jgi:hypothetical protein
MIGKYVFGYYRVGRSYPARHKLVFSPVMATQKMERKGTATSPTIIGSIDATHDVNLNRRCKIHAIDTREMERDTRLDREGNYVERGVST